MRDEQEAIWLVKSATRVIGPFSKKQISDLLRSKQINIIDEIKSPTTRWVFIRENVYFLEVVKMIRQEQDAHQDNTVNSKTVTVMTKTNDMTETIEVPELNEDTSKVENPLQMIQGQELSFKNVDVANNELDQKIQDIEAINIVDNVKTKPVRSTKTYGTVLDKSFRNQTQKSFSMAYIVIGLILTSIIAGVFGYRKYLEYQRTVLVTNNAQRIKSLIAANLYEKAFGQYKLLQTEFVDKDLERMMLPIALQIEKQSNIIRRKAEDFLVSPGVLDKNEKTQLHLVLTESYILDSNFTKAREELAQVAIIDPSNTYMKSLNAVIYYKENEFGKARNESLVLENLPNPAFNLFLKLLVLVDSPDEAMTTELNTKMDIVKHDVARYIEAGNGFLSFELNLLSYIVARKTSDLALANRTFAYFFDSPLRETEKYAKDPLVDWSLSHWDKLNNYCSKAFGEAGSDYRLNLGRAICAFHQGRDTDANAILNQVETAHGLKPELFNLRAQMLIRQKNFGELQKLVTMKEWKPSETSKFSEILTCLMLKQAKCPTEKLEQLIAKSNFKIPAMQLKLENAKNVGASDLLVQVKNILEIEPNYLPALEMRDSLEAKK